MSDSRPIVTLELPADVRGGCSSPSNGSAQFVVLIRGQRTSYSGTCSADKLVKLAEFLVSADSLDCASEPEKGLTPPIAPNDKAEPLPPDGERVRH